MASSKVMSSTSPANPDLPRHSTSTATTSATCSTTTTGLLQHSSAVFHPPPPPPHQQPQAHHHLLHHSDDHSFGSMNMEEILKNIYSDPDTLASAVDGDGSLPAVGAGRNNNVGEVVSKTVDDVWKEIVSGGGAAAAAGGSHEPSMTLEDFLTKAGAVSEEDVRVPGVSSPAPPPVPAPAVGVGGGGGVGYGMEAIMNAAASGVQFPPVAHMQNAPGGFGMESQLGFGNRMVPAGAAGQIRGGAGGTGGGSGSGRGKRRAPPVEDVALDKATQQKQRRMIKNRESAARSRERKQAYTVELESLVTQLEEENARLLKEEADQKKKRFKQTKWTLHAYERYGIALHMVVKFLFNYPFQSMTNSQNRYANSFAPSPSVSIPAYGKLDSSCGAAKTTKSFAESAVNELVGRLLIIQSRTNVEMFHDQLNEVDTGLVRRHSGAGEIA